jgi:hypothetical protein
VGAGAGLWESYFIFVGVWIWIYAKVLSGLRCWVSRRYRFVDAHAIR